jgi:hypothetical protein
LEVVVLVDRVAVEAVAAAAEEVEAVDEAVAAAADIKEVAEEEEGAVTTTWVRSPFSSPAETLPSLGTVVMETNVTFSTLSSCTP